MDRAILQKILELARWAPSGDNTQPWRFEIAGDYHLVVYGHDTRDWCLYDFDGHASHMAHGALLETLRIAATGFGLNTAWSRRPESAEANPVFDIRLTPSSDDSADELFPYITERAVQRRPMSTAPAEPGVLKSLAAAVGPDYELQFFTGWRQKCKVAKLLWRNAHIRLTCPEAYSVHKEIIEWGARYSKDRIPQHAVGVDPATALLMRWVMGDWQRVVFFNRYLFGTVAPRIQLDLLPALLCAGHVLMIPGKPLCSIDDHVDAGIAMQRLWLTVTRLGLHLQPEMTPVIFRWYTNASRSISAQEGIDASAARLASEFEALAGANPATPFAFFCRIGHAPPPESRSIRKDVSELMV